MSVHFSSATDDWETPRSLFDRLSAEFGGFGLDVCASEQNAKCERFYTVKEDGLNQDWRGMCWMNPPYGRTIGAWVKKASESAKGGSTVVCLLPARTDTAWWHEHIMRADSAASEVRFIRGRLKFGKALNSAPFPSCIVIFEPFSRHKLNIPVCVSWSQK